MNSRPLFIDAHIHALDCTEDGLDVVSSWMDRNQVMRCIVHPLKQSLPANPADHERMLANYARYKGKIFRFCIFEPHEVNSVGEAINRLEQEKKDGAIGFGEHYGRGLNFDAPENLRIYEACQKVQLPVMFHMGPAENMDEDGLPRLEHVLTAYPDCILIAHAPGWWSKMADDTCDRLLQKHPNLYADVSAGSGSRAFSRDRQCSREFIIRNSSRLLFGTDCSWRTFAEGNERAPQFTLFEQFDLPEDAKIGLYRNNSEKLFHFR